MLFGVMQSRATFKRFIDEIHFSKFLPNELVCGGVIVIYDLPVACPLQDDGRSLQTEKEVPDGVEINSVNFPPQAIL